MRPAALKDLFDARGFVDIPNIVEYSRSRGLPYVWVWGGRGTGKTYGALKFVRWTEPQRFFLMRRQQTALDIIIEPGFSPFLPIDNDHGILTNTEKIGRSMLAFYDAELMEDGTAKNHGAPLGYGVSLATVKNIRGFNNDAKILIYDEFIPELHDKPIREEYAAYKNAYETINRNRELFGHPPLISIALSNSNKLGNPYFLGMGITETVLEMRKKEIYTMEDQKRGILLIDLKESPIAKEKSNTALYRLDGVNDVQARMAINNEFSSESMSRIHHRNVREYVPIVRIDPITIYRHKSSREWYVTHHKSGSPDIYDVTEVEQVRFRAAYPHLWSAYMNDNIVFDTYTDEVFFRKYFGKNY